ncbi:hypothetical protein D9M69_523550 [compost metagenome]
MLDQKAHRPARVERRQHLRLLQHLPEPGQAQHQEPQQHHRPEDLADHAGAFFLHHEQPDEDGHRDRDHRALQNRRLHLQALDRRQHRDGRRDQAVAVEHGRAHQAQQPDPAPHPGPGLGPRDRVARQRLQRQDAALAVVVGAQHEHHVLERHHEHQAPEDQREQAQHRVGRERHAVLGVHRFLEGIQRRGADVAEDDAQRRDHQPRPGRMCGVARSGRRSSGSPGRRSSCFHRHGRKRDGKWRRRQHSART